MGRLPDGCAGSVVLATLTAVILLSAPVRGDDVERITLEQALRMFEENNLELRILTAERDQALGAVRQTRAYPNPAVAVSHEDLSQSGLHYSESYVTLSQRLEWPGRRSARADSAAEEASALESRLAAERLRLAFEVKRAFIEAATAEERATAIREVLTVVQMAEESGQERFREGDLSGYEARRLRIERARYEELAITAEIELRDARLRLASLILPEVPASEPREIAPTGPPEGAPPSLENLEEKEAIALALEHRSEMRSARSQMAAAEASVRHLSTFTRPDVTLTGGYKRQSDGFDGFILGVSVPLPTFDRRTGDREAAVASRRAALTRVDLTRLSIENDVKRTLSAYASVSERVALIRDQLLGEVDDLLQIARVSYREGEMSLLELLDAAEAFRESRILRAQQSAEHWIRYHDLERAMGDALATTGELEP